MEFQADLRPTFEKLLQKKKEYPHMLHFYLMQFNEGPCAMLHHQSMRRGYWKKQYIQGRTFPFISVSLPRSKLIKYSIQQLQSALVDWLWSAHPPRDEIIMCDSETLRHETKNGNYFLEETTGRSGTSNIFPSNIYIYYIITGFG